MNEQGLSGVRVLDLTWHITGPYCTKYLSDAGAEVIKIERPDGGDPARRIAPFFQDAPHPEKSGLFLHLNTNKRSVTLNLKTLAGKRIFQEMIRNTDILVESFRPHVLPGLGLGYTELEKINPRLVMTSITSFGQTGPYREYKATDMIIYGMGGAMFWTGHPDRSPLRLGGTVISYQAGVMAAVATMMAFYGSEKRGSGEQVDFSVFETIRGHIDRSGTDLIAYQYCGDYDTRAATTSLMYPQGVQPCKDGYVDISGSGVVFFQRTARMLGKPELVEKYGTREAQINPELREEFYNNEYRPWLERRTRREVWEAAQKANLLSGPIFSSRDLLEDPHYEARKYWKEADHPVCGKLLYPGAPYRTDEMPWDIRRPAPLLGQHNDEVYSALQYSPEELARFREDGVI
jgi:crotonobetainyl-CoA:carnitine CoA-transferase CaiB-like acyl-CoA transferase